MPTEARFEVLLIVGINSAGLALTDTAEHAQLLHPSSVHWSGSAADLTMAKSFSAPGAECPSEFLSALTMGGDRDPESLDKSSIS
ncbi:hypothetical protein PENANT_c017G07041 [Penicillium antarcticum]|uniref:Uncharacterized protein n=1 Tax=Penicillium antarcticum TaxID=416450 RepID=A0A1V6Q307_9EURO|nr:hypothetical protein PENANT_c017G07041 [Penicillium antarcticum]